MKIVSYNRHGGRGTSDIIMIATSGDDFNIIDMFCESVLKEYGKIKGLEDTGSYRVVEMAKKLSKITNPLNDNPDKYFEC